MCMCFVPLLYRRLVRLISVFFPCDTYSSWTNKLITAKDHRSVQINIGHLDENGRFNNSFSTIALCGQVRAKGDADSAVDILWTKKRAEIGQ